jgi:opacity protein-like surface antigen
MRPIGLLLAAMLVASPAAAQQAPVVSLVPDDPARWDAAGSIGWRGGNKSDIAPEWDEWFDAATFGASISYHLTTPLKVELDVSTTTDGTVFAQEPFVVPGQPFPLFRFGEHRFRSTSVSAGALYQFGENRWLHPFLGGGLEVVRERARLELEEQRPCAGVPCVPVPVPAEESVSHRGLPFATAGFKWYMTERAFVRSDVRSTFSSGRGIDAVTWRIGIGADF